MDEVIKVNVTIPFSTKRAAEIAYDVLRVDPEPKKGQIKKILEINENILKVEFQGESAKFLRVSLTNFYESLLLCLETQQELGPPLSDSYDHY